MSSSNSSVERIGSVSPVLREAELQTAGQQLGRVGGRIVAETFIGLLQGDPTSYLRTQPSWSLCSRPGRPTISQWWIYSDLLAFYPRHRAR